MLWRQPISTLFPYTTLFRSILARSTAKRRNTFIEGCVLSAESDPAGPSAHAGMAPAIRPAARPARISFCMRPSIVLRRVEVQGHAVDAVAQTGGRRAVGKHAPQVAAALAAVDLGAHHAIGRIDSRFDR